MRNATVLLNTASPLQVFNKGQILLFDRSTIGGDVKRKKSLRVNFPRLEAPLPPAEGHVCESVCRRGGACESVSQTPDHV